MMYLRTPHRRHCSQGARIWITGTRSSPAPLFTFHLEQILVNLKQPIELVHHLLQCKLMSKGATFKEWFMQHMSPESYLFRDLPPKCCLTPPKHSHDAFLPFPDQTDCTQAQNRPQFCFKHHREVRRVEGEGEKHLAA